jgi:hypothetical protein
VTPGWWPWHDGTHDPEPVPAPDELVELTPLGVDVLWRARVDQVDALVVDALRYERRGAWVPADVLLDIRNALHPVERASEVPYVPGPDGATRPR